MHCQSATTSTYYNSSQQSDYQIRRPGVAKMIEGGSLDDRRRKAEI